jgi:hypothetical protein
MSEKTFILDKNLLEIETEKQKFPMVERGGAGSGHHGHRGRPGEVGGSLPSGGAGMLGRSDKLFGSRIVSLPAEKYEHHIMKGLPSAERFFEDHPNGGLVYKVKEVIEKTPSIEEGDEPITFYALAHKNVKSPKDADNPYGFSSWRITKIDENGVPFGHWDKEIDDTGSIDYFIEGLADIFDIEFVGAVALETGAIKRFVERGGPGSGHFGHEGRPGEVGGSLPGDQISMFGEIDPGKKKLMEYEGPVIFEQSLRKRLRASKDKFSWNGKGGQFLIGNFGKDKVFLSHMHADITGVGKHEGEGRGTRMLVEVLEESANRGLMKLRINAASEAAQALFNRFERWGILKPTKTFKDIGGVSENTVEWEILVDNPAEVVAEKWVKMENKSFYPDLDEMGSNAYVAQSTIKMDGGDIVAVAKLRRQTIFKRRPYSLEVRYFKRNRSRPMLRSEKLMGEMLAADLERSMKLDMVERGWMRAPAGRDFWLPSWEQLENLRLVTRGGLGSGHHGHRGRPGKVGGSLPSDQADPRVEAESEKLASEHQKWWEDRRADFAKRLLEKYGDGKWDTGAWIGPNGKYLAPLEDHQQTAMELMGWEADLTTHDGMVKSGMATDEVVRAGIVRYNVSEIEAFFDVPSINETTDSQWASMAAVVTRLNQDIAKRFERHAVADVTITIGASLSSVEGGETYAVGREAYEWLGLEDEYDYGVMRGGPGSGHFNHEGRPGEVGGSLPGGSVAAKPIETGRLPSLDDIKFFIRDIDQIEQDGLEDAYENGNGRFEIEDAERKLWALVVAARRGEEEDAGYSIDDIDLEKEVQTVLDVYDHFLDVLSDPANAKAIVAGDRHGQRMIETAKDWLEQIQKEDADEIFARRSYAGMNIIITNNEKRVGAGSSDVSTKSAKVFWSPVTLDHEKSVLEDPERGFNFGISPVYVLVHELHHGFGSGSELDKFSDAVAADYLIKHTDLMGPETEKNMLDTLSGMAWRGSMRAAGEKKDSVLGSRAMFGWLYSRNQRYFDQYFNEVREQETFRSRGWWTETDESKYKRWAKEYGA